MPFRSVVRFFIMLRNAAAGLTSSCQFCCVPLVLSMASQSRRVLRAAPAIEALRRASQPAALPLKIGAVALAEGGTVTVAERGISTGRQLIHAG